VNVNPPNGHVGPGLLDSPPEYSVAAPKVQDASALGDEGDQSVPEHADPARENDATVDPAEKTHRRCIPRMLRKKLERIV
jgi:hypothetical protein